MNKAKSFLTKDEQQVVVSAIEQAELNTSGEIRVHIEPKCKEDLLDHAAYIFERLEMHQTQLRNGVLFYVSMNPKGFAILGDAGINKKVPADFWDNIKEQVIGSFKKGAYGKGLANGIQMAGEQLKVHFPYQLDDINELSNEISFGEN
jgi:uncharacterized membrane protein